MSTNNDLNNSIAELWSDSDLRLVIDPSGESHYEVREDFFCDPEDQEADDELARALRTARMLTAEMDVVLSR